MWQITKLKQTHLNTKIFQKKQAQKALLEAHERLEKQEGVTHVLSLKNAQVFTDAGGFMESTTLFENGEVTDMSYCEK